MGLFTKTSGTGWSLDKGSGTLTISGDVYVSDFFKIRSKVRSIVAEKGVRFRHCGCLFEEMENLEKVDLSGVDISECKDLAMMFFKCTNLRTLKLAGWNTSHVTNMLSLFSGCKKLEILDLTGWHVSTGTNTSGMFDDVPQTVNIIANDESVTALVKASRASYKGNKNDHSDAEIQAIKEEPKPAKKVAHKSEAKTEPKVEAKPAPKAEIKPAVKEEPKPAPAPKPVAESKVAREAISAQKPESKTESEEKPNAATETQPKHKGLNVSTDKLEELKRRRKERQEQRIKADERNTVDGFTPRNLSSELVTKLYDECLSKEGDSIEECVRLFMATKRNGFPGNGNLVMFNIARLQEHYREILFFLGQLKPVHQRDGKYMSYEDMSVKYNGIKWSSGSESSDCDPVICLAALGAASLNNSIIPLVSTFFKVVNGDEWFSGIKNFSVEKTYDPYSDSEIFDPWWSEHRNEWTRDRHSTLKVNGQQDQSDEQSVGEALLAGTIIMLGMPSKVSDNQKEKLKETIEHYHFYDKEYPEIMENCAKLQFASGHFMPLELNEVSVKALYDICLAASDTDKENVIGEYFYRKSNGYGDSSDPESLGNVFFDKAKLQKHYKSIAYLLGQLYDIHKTQDCYLYLKNLGLNYKGERWTSSKDDMSKNIIFKLVALGYHAEDKDGIRLISAPYQYKQACINFRIPATFSPNDEPAYEKWLMTPEAKLWNINGKDDVPFDIRRDTRRYYEPEEGVIINGMNMEQLKARISRYHELSKKDQDLLFYEDIIYQMPAQIFAQLIYEFTFNNPLAKLNREYGKELTEVSRNNCITFVTKEYIRHYLKKSPSADGGRMFFFNGFTDYLATFPEIQPVILQCATNLKRDYLIRIVKEIGLIIDIIDTDTALNAGKVEELKGNYTEAVRQYKISAASGNSLGAWNLGRMFEQGLGTSKEIKEGFRWTLQAAEMGFVDAQADIAFRYYEGWRGAPMDKTKAAKWYEKAAAQGDVDSMAFLGMLYFNGEGVTRNKEKAKELLQKAANQGSEAAKKVLRQYY